MNHEKIVADVHESHRTQVAQLLGERRNAVAYGQRDVVAAVDRQLAAFGVRDVGEAKESEGSAEGRGEVESAESAKAAARSRAPQGRSTGPKQTA